MKLIAYTLVDVLDYLERQDTHRIVTLMGRVHRLMRMMTAQLDLLETMSPKEYQQIRLQLGNGSGQESPGFKLILRLPPDLWRAFKASYLDGRRLTATEGTWVQIPAGVAHEYACTGGDEARFLELHTPSCGYGAYLRTLAGFDQELV